MKLGALVKAALAEDIGSGDITTRLTIDPQKIGTGKIISRERGVVSGLMVVHEVFRQIDRGLKITDLFIDGQSIVANDIICEFHGKYASILTGERTALNFLGRLSGIATITRKYANRISGTKAVLLDTRKTTPLLRSVEKNAVLDGGGRNHRMGLFDMILIKDNHQTGAKDIKTALELTFKGFQTLGRKVLVEVEVQKLDQIEEVLRYPVDRIMLDNFDLEAIEKAVKLIKGRVPIEVSGGVSTANIYKIALTGVDYISVGSITHSAYNLDFTLLVE